MKYFCFSRRKADRFATVRGMNVSFADIRGAPPRLQNLPSNIRPVKGCSRVLSKFRAALVGWALMHSIDAAIGWTQEDKTRAHRLAGTTVDDNMADPDHIAENLSATASPAPLDLGVRSRAAAMGRKMVTAARCFRIDEAPRGR
jgi:hypothetical protein